MTARYFYEACATIYSALGLHRENVIYQFEEQDTEHKRYGIGKQTPKEMYYALADGIIHRRVFQTRRWMIP